MGDEGLDRSRDGKSTSCWPLLLLLPMPRVWEQHYLPLDQGGTWIADEDRVNAATLIHSPSDLDAKAAKKRSTFWVGYQAHFTQTCDEDLPLEVTQVTTTIGPPPDGQALPAIHAV